MVTIAEEILFSDLDLDMEAFGRGLGRVDVDVEDCVRGISI